MVLKRKSYPDIPVLRFENDVETYGTQTVDNICQKIIWFENDVETYGTQTKQLRGQPKCKWYSNGMLLWCLYVFV